MRWRMSWPMRELMDKASSLNCTLSSLGSSCMVLCRMNWLFRNQASASEVSEVLPRKVLRVPQPPSPYHEGTV